MRFALTPLGWLAWGLLAFPGLPGAAAQPATTRKTPAPNASTLNAVPPPALTPGTTSLIEGEIVPPLSIYETLLLLRETLQTLEASSGRPPEMAVLERAGHRLKSVLAYIERVDAAHPTLPYYTWTPVVAEKVVGEQWTTQVFHLPRPVEKVTALALRAHNADIEIRQMTVIDQNQTHWEFNQVIPVRADQPRPEVCFLNLPTRLNEIRLTTRWVNRGPQSPRPRIFLEAGRCAQTEAGKQACYRLRLALRALEQSDPAEGARQTRKAFRLLEEFKKSRQL